jgi:PBP1b-binding outer membrane lipoprotein LpoB
MESIRWESGVLMKKVSVICLLVVGIILIYGCLGEEKTKSKTSTSSESSINKTSASHTTVIPTFDLVPSLNKK